MHTLSNKKIEKEKITLLKLNKSFNANDLLEYMYNQSSLNFSLNLPFLYKYINEYILRK